VHTATIVKAMVGAMKMLIFWVVTSRILVDIDVSEKYLPQHFGAKYGGSMLLPNVGAYQEVDTELPPRRPISTCSLLYSDL
jgi:hypothetical protein